MRALVAESNVVTRVTLTRILERSGFQVEELHDELAAACLLYQPDPPEVAILALDTLLVDFELVCDTMRAAKPDVYIVALVPDARRNDLVHILKTGADDFLMKPVTIQEADARIYNIQRLLTFRSAEHGDEEAGTRGGSRRNGAGEKKGRGTDGAGEPVDIAEFVGAAKTVFSQMGMQLEEAELSESASYDYSAWVPLVLPFESSAEWINLRIDVDQASLAYLHQHATKASKSDEGDLLKLLQDVTTLVQDGLQRAVSSEHARPIFTPVLPIALPPSRLPSPPNMVAEEGVLQQARLDFGDQLGLRLVLTQETVQPTKRTALDLKRLDILAAPIQSSDEERMLLREGVMLTDDYIEKVRGFVQSYRLKPGATVYRPPSSMVVFLHNELSDED